ncbi:transposase [Streptococcus pneumoniae]|nr:transposase [Streptococcus pneumoniae]
MSRVHVQIMNQFHRKSHEYKAIKRYWKLIQQDSRKLGSIIFVVGKSPMDIMEPILL